MTLIEKVPERLYRRKENYHCKQLNLTMHINMVRIFPPPCHGCVWYDKCKLRKEVGKHTNKNDIVE